jgi:hypothetical protein
VIWRDDDILNLMLNEITNIDSDADSDNQGVDAEE